MKASLSAYLASLLVFLCLDGLWLGVLMGPTYRELIGPLMLDKPVWWAAVVFYLLYVLGIQLVGVGAGLRVGRWPGAAGASAVLGLMAYGTYDLTNLATLKGWSTELTFLDMGWGMFASAVAGTVGYVVKRRING